MSSAEPLRIAVIGGGLDVLLRARELAIEVTLVHWDQRYNYRDEYQALCQELLLIDFEADYDELERSLLRRHRQRPFRRIVSLDEDGLVPAARLNQLLGLGGNGVLTSWLLKDKSLMRQALAEHGVSPVTAEVVRSGRQAADFVARTGRSVLKPLDLTGSLDVTVVGDAGEASAAWQRATERGYRQLLAEQYLDGPEFSVDTFSWQGRHVVLAITRKLLRDQLEIGHSMPSALSAEDASSAEKLVSQALDAVGLMEGPAHTEIRFTADGPRVIESQDRIGGSRLPELMELALGIDITRLALAVPLGIDPPLTGPPVPLGGAAVRYFLPEAGRLVAITGTDQVPVADDLRLVLKARPGDEIAVQQTSYDRNALGCWVVAAGPDEASAIERCERVIATVELVTVADLAHGSSAPAPGGSDRDAS